MLEHRNKPALYKTIDAEGEELHFVRYKEAAEALDVLLELENDYQAEAHAHHEEGTQDIPEEVLDRKPPRLMKWSADLGKWEESE